MLTDCLRWDMASSERPSAFASLQEQALPSAVPGQIIELHQFCDDCFFPSVANALGNAGLQMVFQNERLEFLDGLAYRIGLAQNVNAILVLFNHLANTTNMSFDVVQPFEDIRLVSTHLSSPLILPHPGGYGDSVS